MKAKYVEEFQEFMESKYPKYLLASKSDDLLIYEKETPKGAQKFPLAGCLMLFFVVPGILYLLLTKNQEKYTLKFKVEKGIYSMFGDAPAQDRIMKKFNNFLRKKGKLFP